jgi:hypothetical protein
MQLTKHFTTMQRDNKTIYILKDDSPEFMQDLVCSAHEEGKLLPDDHRYQMIYESLESLENNNFSDDALTDLEPPVYNWQLLNWLSSNLYRASFCDDAVEQGLVDGRNIFTTIAAGYSLEQEEVFTSIHNFLEARPERLP